MSINDLLWFFAVIMAIVFLITGYVKVFREDVARYRFPWTKDLPRGLVVFIGLVEIAGALGLVLPAATGIYPQLTPLAAIGLAVLMVMAGTFHSVRHEYDSMAINLLMFLMTAFVGMGRLMLVPFS